MRALLLGHVLVTWFLAGLIWTIQVVHYPSFELVGGAAFPRFHAAHLTRITSVVLVPMVLEVVSGLAMLGAAPLVPRWSAWVGLGLLAVIWASTALVQVPLHDALGASFSVPGAERLVATNWVRTAAWSARAGLVAWWAWQLIASKSAVD